jgi:cobalt-zinc-cadmium resistance protein CzcA
MLKRIIDFHLEHRWFVLIGVFGIVALGLYSMLQIPVDAFPDLTNNQVVVIVQSPGMAPADVEQLITFPIETSLMGIPKTQGIRSTSKLGLSIVTVVFDDSVNTYFARQLVNERLQEVRARMPQGVEPSLGPVATAFGEVFQYTLEGRGLSAMDLKTLQEWQIRTNCVSCPASTRSTPGEARPNSIRSKSTRTGCRYGLTLRDVLRACPENNANFGGGFIEHASSNTRFVGWDGLDRADLEQIVLTARPVPRS